MSEAKRKAILNLKARKSNLFKFDSPNYGGMRNVYDESRGAARTNTMGDILSVDNIPISTPIELDVLQSKNAVSDIRSLAMKELETGDHTEEEETALNFIIGHMCKEEEWTEAEAKFWNNFMNWILGNPDDEDRNRTPWFKDISGRINPHRVDMNLAAVYGDIAAYVNTFVKARERFITQLKRMDLEGPRGLVQAYLYYKYKVRKSGNNEFLKDFSTIDALGPDTNPAVLGIGKVPDSRVSSLGPMSGSSVAKSGAPKSIGPTSQTVPPTQTPPIKTPPTQTPPTKQPSPPSSPPSSQPSILSFKAKAPSKPPGVASAPGLPQYNGPPTPPPPQRSSAVKRVPLSEWGKYVEKIDDVGELEKLGRGEGIDDIVKQRWKTEVVEEHIRDIMKETCRNRLEAVQGALQAQAEEYYIGDRERPNFKYPANERLFDEYYRQREVDDARKRGPIQPPPSQSGPPPSPWKENVDLSEWIDYLNQRNDLQTLERLANGKDILGSVGGYVRVPERNQVEVKERATEAAQERLRKFKEYLEEKANEIIKEKTTWERLHPVLRTNKSNRDYINTIIHRKKLVSMGNPYVRTIPPAQSQPTQPPPPQAKFPNVQFDESIRMEDGEDEGQEEGEGQEDYGGVGQEEEVDQDGGQKRDFPQKLYDETQKRINYFQANPRELDQAKLPDDLKEKIRNGQAGAFYGLLKSQTDFDSIEEANKFMDDEAKRVGERYGIDIKEFYDDDEYVRLMLEDDGKNAPAVLFRHALMAIRDKDAQQVPLRDLREYLGTLDEEDRRKAQGIVLKNVDQQTRQRVINAVNDYQYENTDNETKAKWRLWKDAAEKDRDVRRQRSRMIANDLRTNGRVDVDGNRTNEKDSFLNTEEVSYAYEECAKENDLVMNYVKEGPRFISMDDVGASLDNMKERLKNSDRTQIGAFVHTHRGQHWGAVNMRKGRQGEKEFVVTFYDPMAQNNFTVPKHQMARDIHYQKMAVGWQTKYWEHLTNGCGAISAQILYNLSKNPDHKFTAELDEVGIRRIQEIEDRAITKNYDKLRADFYGFEGPGGPKLYQFDDQEKKN